MGIISVEQADRLFWLGRYTERVYTTLRMYSQSFDVMIDEITDSYQDFCRKIDIPDIYGSKEVFKERYPFDTDMVSVPTKNSGIFESVVHVGDEVEKGQLLARIIDCYEGEVVEELRAPADGIIFFMHGEPLTYSQTAVFKLILHVD